MTLKTKLIIIIILSLLAFLNSFYLAYDWIFPIETATNSFFQPWNIIQDWWKICDINSTFSCTIVANSDYSKVFGIPFAIYAMFMFFVVFIWSIVWLFKKGENILKLLVIPTWIWVLVNMYLFYLEIFVLKVFCPICIIISIFLFTMFFISLHTNLKCITKQ